MNEETKLPDGLQLAIQYCNIGTTHDRRNFAEDAIRAEHAKRMTLQHHAANLAQRVADLEAVRDTYKAAWTGYHPLAEYMQGLADGGNLPGMIGEHFGDIAIKRMKGQDARITDLEKERDELRSRTELAESRLAVMLERDGARDEQLRLACRERDELRTLITQARPVPAIPEGWKLVPLEPTPNMLDVGRKRMSALGMYTTMLAVAPEHKE